MLKLSGIFRKPRPKQLKVAQIHVTLLLEGGNIIAAIQDDDTVLAYGDAIALTVRPDVEAYDKHGVEL